MEVVEKRLVLDDASSRRRRNAVRCCDQVTGSVTSPVTSPQSKDYFRFDEFGEVVFPFE